MKQIEALKNEQRHILVFSLKGDEFGLDISCVREVLTMQHIYPLPKAPQFIEGVINLRGHIVALIDLAEKMDIRSAGQDGGRRIIICRLRQFIAGIIVDGVSEVLGISKEQIQPPPEIVSRQVKENYIWGIARVGEKVIMLLDLEHILSEKEAESMAKVRKA